MRLSNPYSMAQTIEKLTKLLTANNDAIALLKKALDKANNETTYADLLEQALLKGSTIELREAFSPFGKYLRDTEPGYPHTNAVNFIDTAMYYLKMGFIDKEGNRREVPDLYDQDKLEICAVITDTCNDGSSEARALFGVVSGKMAVTDYVDDKDLNKIYYTVYARDNEGYARAVHDSDTLEQANYVARFIKGCNLHLQIETN